MAETLGILLISGGHERAHYAFVTASAAAAIGRDVVIFATNHGCAAFCDDSPEFLAADREMKTKGVATLAELREACVAMDVRMIACEAGLRVSGLAASLLVGIEVAGVVTFLEAVGPGQIITL
jgi:peroxiredoxin family protein